ncbi:MAG: hypothetical protein WBA89_18225 [Microcoleus sp.]
MTLAGKLRPKSLAFLSKKQSDRTPQPLPNNPVIKSGKNPQLLAKNPVARLRNPRRERRGGCQ